MASSSIPVDQLPVPPIYRAEELRARKLVRVIQPVNGATLSAAVAVAQSAAQQVVASKASAGANSDITSLSGLATPLSISQGGTGSITQGGARTALGLPLVPGDPGFAALMAAIWTTWTASLPVWSGSGPAPVPTGQPYNLGPGGPVVIAQ